MSEGHCDQDPGDQAHEPHHRDERGRHRQGQSQAPGSTAGLLRRQADHPHQEQAEYRDQGVYQGGTQAALGDGPGGHGQQGIGGGQPQPCGDVTQDLAGQQMGGPPGQWHAAQQQQGDGQPRLAEGDGGQQSQEPDVGGDGTVRADPAVGVRGQVQRPQVACVARDGRKCTTREKITEEQ